MNKKWIALLIGLLMLVLVAAASAETVGGRGLVEQCWWNLRKQGYLLVSGSQYRRDDTDRQGKHGQLFFMGCFVSSVG